MGLFDEQTDPPEGPHGEETHKDAASASGERPTLAEYKTNGRTEVRTLRGHQVVPSNKDLPQFGASGIKVTAEEAEALIEEFPDYVYKVDTDENGGN